jgi:hypothetical protein
LTMTSAERQPVQISHNQAQRIGSVQLRSSDRALQDAEWRI